MKYLLHVEDDKVLEVVSVSEDAKSMADVITEHSFVIYPGAIYCGPDESDPHWEANGSTDDELIKKWAEHLANAIQTQCGSWEVK